MAVDETVFNFRSDWQAALKRGCNKREEFDSSCVRKATSNDDWLLVKHPETLPSENDKSDMSRVVKAISNEALQEDSQVVSNSGMFALDYEKVYRDLELLTRNIEQSMDAKSDHLNSQFQSLFCNFPRARYDNQVQFLLDNRSHQEMFFLGKIALVTLIKASAGWEYLKSNVSDWLD